jgi:hypothetical protein
MKPILFWTIRHMYGEFDLVGVTHDARGHFYGRDARGRTTHLIEAVSYGRFDRKEDAEAKLAGVKLLLEEEAARLKPHRDAIATIQCVARRDVRAWLAAPAEQPTMIREDA